MTATAERQRARRERVERERVERDHAHRDVSGGWLRPTVFGAMDGLVTNVSLIAGVGGGGLDPSKIVLTGLAGLVAGAFSMATGEYTSVASQNELVHAEVEIERRQLEAYPEEEQAELAEAIAGKGVDAELAEEVAEQVSQDPDEALRLHAIEELGVDPTDLPSPIVAALSSFFAFAAGAVVPLIPYLAGAANLLLALAVAAVALFLAGAWVGRLTASSMWSRGLRQLALATLATGVTYAVGRAIGTTVS